MTPPLLDLSLGNDDVAPTDLAKFGGEGLAESSVDVAINLPYGYTNFFAQGSVRICGVTVAEKPMEKVTSGTRSGRQVFSTMPSPSYAQDVYFLPTPQICSVVTPNATLCSFEAC